MSVEILSVAARLDDKTQSCNWTFVLLNPRKKPALTRMQKNAHRHFLCLVTLTFYFWTPKIKGFRNCHYSQVIDHFLIIFCLYNVCTVSDILSQRLCVSSDFTALYKCYFIVIIYYYTFMVHMIALIFRSGLVATRQLKLQVMCALQLA